MSVFHSISQAQIEGRLDLASKLDQDSLAEPISAVRRGETLQSPIVVELDITTFCDLACPECISLPLLNRGRFSKDRAIELAAEIADAGVRAVILIGGGEPLLHPVVDSVIRTLTERDVAVGLTTNGTQINRYLDVIATHVQWTRVSVDAATPHTYDIFRPRRGGTRETFVEVITNMTELASRKTGALGFSFLLLARSESHGDQVQHNFHEIAEAAQLARELGCDYFEVKPEYDSDHFSVAYPSELREIFDQQFAAAQEFATPDFQILGPSHLSDVLTENIRSQPKNYSTCPTTELRTLLAPSGAFLCPYHRGNPKARYGDPATTSFADLWNSPERQDASSQLRPSQDCQFHCIRHQSNLSLLNDPAPSETAPDYDPFI